MHGIIHSYESLAAVDGKGLRYAVFFAGCPLRCIYCHNPDTWIMSGTKVSADDLVRKISRYKTYFGSKGGVTFSGGEPLLQADFIKEMIIPLRECGINYAIDTSGAVDLTENAKEVLNNAQTVILDLKFWDNENYKKYTGVGIDKTLKILSYLNEKNINTWIRTVIVPGINDSKKYLDKYLDILKSYDCIEKYELLPFHTMGFFKYEKLGIDNPLINVDALEDVDEFQRYVNDGLGRS